LGGDAGLGGYNPGRRRRGRTPSAPTFDAFIRGASQAILEGEAGILFGGPGLRCCFYKSSSGMPLRPEADKDLKRWTSFAIRV